MKKKRFIIFLNLKNKIQNFLEAKWNEKFPGMEKQD